MDNSIDLSTFEMNQLAFLKQELYCRYGHFVRYEDNTIRRFIKNHLPSVLSNKVIKRSEVEKLNSYSWDEVQDIVEKIKTDSYGESFSEQLLKKRKAQREMRNKEKTIDDGWIYIGGRW